MNILITIKQKITIYALICIYAFALVKPIVPIVNDTIAHIFFKMDHLATVHFENGKYHIHAELQQAAETTDSKSTPLISSFFDTLSNHLKTETTISLNLFPITLSKPQFPSINFPVDICLKSPTPPPKA